MKWAPLIALTSACCSLLSCVYLTDNQNTLQVLMGRDSSELYSALGPPQSLSGTPANGIMQWSKANEAPVELDTIPDYDAYFYEINAETQQNRIVKLNHNGKLDFTLRSWWRHNYPYLALNQACAQNDLPEVQNLLRSYPQLRIPDNIAEAAAQAARYKSTEVLNYLILAYKVDIHAPIDTFRIYENGSFDRYTLARTSIAELVQLRGD